MRHAAAELDQRHHIEKRDETDQHQADDDVRADAPPDARLTEFSPLDEARALDDALFASERDG